PFTVYNKANKTAGLKEDNNSAAKNGDKKLIRDTSTKKNEEPVDQEDQAFLEELARLKRQEKEADDAAETLRKTFAKSTEDLLIQTGAARASSTNYVNTSSTPINTASTPVNTASTPINTASTPINIARPSRNIPDLEDIYEVPTDGIFTNASYNDEGVVADFTNLESTVNVDALQEELLQFKTQQVWILVYLPFRKNVIGTKWVYRNKKDEQGIVVRNKARLVAQGHRQEERINYDEVFSPVAMIEAIGIFLAFASYIGFIVYQMDVKSAFLYGKIDEEVYVSQSLGFRDPKFGKKIQKRTHRQDSIYKKDKKDIMLKEDGIFISRDKYVAEILKKFDFISVKTASTSIETKKPLVKDGETANVDVHLCRSMIGSLMYLTASRLDIMYPVCACSRFQVTLKTSHLHAVKRIFRKNVIGTKWVYMNKKDEQGIVVRNKARLVAQGHRQEERIDYDEVFSPVAMIEAIGIFLAFASYIGFIVYQMDVKSTFLYGKIDEEVYVSQSLGFRDPKFGKKVYRVIKALSGLHQAPRACTSIETKKPLVKDGEAADVDVHLCRSMIGSLMYLTTSRPDIMYAVCACSRESSFNLEAYSDSDYAGANLDRKSTIREAEYVAAASCCGDAYKKKLIQVLKIHTDDNVADLLTKTFDVSRATSGTQLMLPVLVNTGRKKVSTVRPKLNTARSVFSKNEKFRKGVSAAVETLSTATLTISTAEITFFLLGVQKMKEDDEVSNEFKCVKEQIKE
nr:ribonuclease H-like domain, reverse transcriptase, RNA-dependent DNA polymerase [Tanacetum cinerariifolium]